MRQKKITKTYVRVPPSPGAHPSLIKSSMKKTLAPSISLRNANNGDEKRRTSMYFLTAFQLGDHVRQTKQRPPSPGAQSARTTTEQRPWTRRRRRRTRARPWRSRRIDQGFVIHPSSRIPRLCCFCLFRYFRRCSVVYLGSCVYC